MKQNYFFLIVLVAILGTLSGNAQEHTLEGIELEFIPNDGSHNRFTSSRWDPRVSIYRDKTYNAFFHTRTLGWNGGDGFYSTPLPDGNTFWSVADSFFGQIFDDRVRGGSENNFPRNGAIIMTGLEAEDFYCVNELFDTDNPNSNLYYKGKTWLRHPAASKTEEQINNGEVDSDILYWPGDATVYKDTLQVIWGAVDENMTRSETAYTEYVIDGTPDNPGPEGYLRLVHYERHFKEFTNNYGSGIWEDYVEDGGDGHTYYYGSHDGFPVVARSETHDMKSKWTYYIKDEAGEWSWQEATPTDEEMSRSRICNHWMTNINIIKHEGKYYFISQEVMGPEVYIWEGVDKPWGPVSANRKIIYTTEGVTPRNKPDLNTTSYNSFISSHLSIDGELLLSFNANPADFWDNFGAPGSADLYQAYFVRIFGWENVFEPLPEANFKSIEVIGGNGTITPNEPFRQEGGKSVTFEIIPDEGYVVDEFSVYNNFYQYGGISASNIRSNGKFILSNATGEYEIKVSFKKDITSIGKTETDLLKVYPNPVSDQLFIETADDISSQWELYDMAGTLLQRGSSVASFEINVSEYPNGVYLLRLLADQQTIMKKIIIEK